MHIEQPLGPGQRVLIAVLGLLVVAGAAALLVLQLVFFAVTTGLGSVGRLSQQTRYLCCLLLLEVMLRLPVCQAAARLRRTCTPSRLQRREHGGL